MRTRLKHVSVPTLVLLSCSVVPAQRSFAGQSSIARIEEHGRIVYTNFGAPEHPRTEHVAARARKHSSMPAAVPSRPSPAFASRSIRTAYVNPDILSMIDAAANRYALDPLLVREIARQESNFSPTEVSEKGAIGVMQLMPETARELGVSDPFDPAQNIDAGARFLRDLYKHYNGNVRLMLAAYNAGPAAVARYGHRVPPYRETVDYVRTISRRYSRAAAGSPEPIRHTARMTAMSAPGLHIARDGSGRSVYVN